MIVETVFALFKMWHLAVVGLKDKLICTLPYLILEGGHLQNFQFFHPLQFINTPNLLKFPTYPIIVNPSPPI